MATIDLHPLIGNEFVLHFGGRASEVDAYTFANSILAFSEALREISNQLQPEYRIEIAIEAVGTGSFRAKLKTSSSRLSSLFKEASVGLIIAVLGAFIYDKLLAPPIQVITSDDSVIVQHGSDRIIIPRAAYDATKRLPRPEEVDRHITRAFDVLEEDASVIELGLTPRIDDPQPVANIPRDDFGRLSKPGLSTRPSTKTRTVAEEAKLFVVRAVLERGDRKWQFVWNGHRISAPIKDHSFFDRLAAREFEFGQGDALEGELTIHQTLDDASGAYVNDFYEVTRVDRHIPGPTQIQLFPNG